MALSVIFSQELKSRRGFLLYIVSAMPTRRAADRDELERYGIEIIHFEAWTFLDETVMYIRTNRRVITTKISHTPRYYGI